LVSRVDLSVSLIYVVNKGIFILNINISPCHGCKNVDFFFFFYMWWD